MFTHSTTPLIQRKITVADTLFGRFYTTPENNRYPSITTILGAEEKPWLSDWRTSIGEAKANKEVKRATDRGTAVHSMIENYLNNKPNCTSDFSPEHITEFNSVRIPLNKISNVLSQETAMYSDILRVAGRVDCVGDYNKITSIIDFKTATRGKKSEQIEDYYLQTTAYALMVQELYGIQVEQLVIIMSVENGVPMVFIRKIEPYIEPLVLRINKYYRMIEARK